MASLPVSDRFIIGITDYIDIVEKEIEIFKNNNNPLEELNNELLKLSEFKKFILGLVLSLSFSDKNDKFIDQAYQKRMVRYRHERDNLVKKYQFEDILFVSERENLKEIAEGHHNKLLEFEHKKHISELEDLEKKLTYELLLHTRTNFVLMEQFDRKMTDMMMNKLPKHDSIIKRTILDDLERLNVEDTIVSFLSYSRKISITTIQCLQARIKSLDLKTSSNNDSGINDKSDLGLKKKRKKRKKKRNNLELFGIVKIQTIFRKYRQREFYLKILTCCKIIQTFSRRLFYQQRYQKIKKGVHLFQRELSFRRVYRNSYSLRQRVGIHIQKTQLELESLRKYKHQSNSFKNNFIELGQLKYQLLIVCFSGAIKSSNPHTWIPKYELILQNRHQEKRKFLLKHQILIIEPTLAEDKILKSIQECTDRLTYLRGVKSKSKKNKQKIYIQSNKLGYLEKKHDLLFKYHQLKESISMKWGNTQEEQQSDVNRILRTLDCLELEDLCVSFDAFLQYEHLLKYTAQEKRLDQPSVQNPVSRDKSVNNQSLTKLGLNKEEHLSKCKVYSDTQQEKGVTQRQRLDDLEKEVSDFFTKRFIEVFRTAASGELDIYPHGKKAPFEIMGDCGFSPEEQELIYQKQQQFNVDKN